MSSLSTSPPTWSGSLEILHRLLLGGPIGVQSSLIDSLISYPVHLIDWIFPQLIYLYIVSEDIISSRIYSLFITRCGLSIDFTLKLLLFLLSEDSLTSVSSTWILSSINSKYVERRRKLITFAEMALINSNDQSTHSNSSNSLSDDEVYLALVKKVKCEYFNAILGLIHHLIHISTLLKRQPPSNRKQQLCRYLRHLNRSGGVYGLYLPSTNHELNESSKHYRLLRIVPDESAVLSSRDKVPFMFFAEIEWTLKSVYDQDIYTAYKSQQHIIKEAKELSQGTTESDGQQAENDHSSALHASDADPSHRRSVDDVVKLIEVQGQNAQHKAKLQHDMLLSTEALNSSHGHKRHSLPHTNSVPRNLGELKNIAKRGSPQSSYSLHVSTTNSPSSQTRNGDSFSFTSSDGNDDYLFNSEWRQLDASFGISLSSRRENIRSLSVYGDLSNWDLMSFIFKAGDDCRQEMIAMQLIQLFHRIFLDAQLPLVLRPYSVLVTSSTSGLIETIPDAVSVDSLKKNTTNFISLAHFFHSYFGGQGNEKLEIALKTFVESMAAYSLVSYFLQLKDRHNGNILLDRSGAIIHIDYGFMLGNSPGGNLNFEQSPFKLTQEYVEVMGSDTSPHFNYFKHLFLRGFLELRSHSTQIITLTETIIRNNTSSTPCFVSSGLDTINDLQDRFQLELTDPECIEFAADIIEQATDNWRTVQYDSYQKTVNNIH